MTTDTDELDRKLVSKIVNFISHAPIEADYTITRAMVKHFGDGREVREALDISLANLRELIALDEEEARLATAPDVPAVYVQVKDRGKSAPISTAKNRVKNTPISTKRRSTRRSPKSSPAQLSLFKR